MNSVGLIRMKVPMSFIGQALQVGRESSGEVCKLDDRRLTLSSAIHIYLMNFLQFHLPLQDGSTNEQHRKPL
jgi:hypothetical protein